MKGYKELVEALRYCASSNECGKECPYWGGEEDCCKISKMETDAAYAIEELQFVVQAQDKVMREYARQLLEETPKHGEWIYTGEQDDSGNYYCRCSVCGAGDAHAIKGTVPFCWNCGAQMSTQSNDSNALDALGKEQE